MLIDSIQLSVYNWAVANVPRSITFDGGGLDSGFVEVNVNGTLVTQSFDTDKPTTLQALADRLIDEVPDIGNTALYYSAGYIRIIPANNTALTIVLNNQFAPDIIMGVENAVSVIWMNENGPRPEFPYISLNFSTYEKIGNHADMYPVNDAGVLASYQIVEFVLSLQAYGDESIQILKDLQQSFDRWSVRQDLYANDGLCLFDVYGGVRDISAIIGSKEEKRAMLDLRGRSYDSFKDKVGVIETVNGQQIVKSIKQDITTNFTINLT